MYKRQLLEDPFEYRGLREYAPFDEPRTINWKATARTGNLMVNLKGYTALRAVRIFLNLEDRGIWKRQELLELCIRIAVRIAGELLRQGIRTAVYCNARDVLTGEVMHLLPGAGAGHMEQLNRAFAKMCIRDRCPQGLRENTMTRTCWLWERELSGRIWLSALWKRFWTRLFPVRKSMCAELER